MVPEKNKPELEAISTLTGAIEKARSSGISQNKIIELIGKVFQSSTGTETSPETEKRETGINSLLESKLLSLTLEELPPIPPKASINYRGKELNNDSAIPNQESLEAVRELIPNIKSIISLTFQGVGFVCQQDKNGFKAADIHGYDPYFSGETWIKLEKTNLKDAIDNLKDADREKAPICASKYHLNQLASHYGEYNIILLKDPKNLTHVQLIVRKAETSSYSYPAPANPEWQRGNLCPVLITFENPEKAVEFKKLLKENPYRTLHTLFAIILTPGITTDFVARNSELSQPKIIQDGLPQDPNYRHNVTGFMFIPIPLNKTTLVEVTLKR